ncbi:MAG: DUF87 domain-containing protein [Chloroflexi bacterium]|nr:DUF87 domain-containing protein [Chloroflexota bacterium]
MQDDTTNSQSNSLLGSLVKGAGSATQDPMAFRERAVRVGSVYTISYSSAIVAIYDHDREDAGGLPKSIFLMAAKSEGDGTFILLRVQKEARLPSAAANDIARQQGVEASGNEESWGDRLDPWMRDQLSLHALECSVLGTFMDQGDGTYIYAEDIDNYYAVHELMVWKPDPQSLNLIVNYRNRSNGIPIEVTIPIGETRFAAAERPSAAKVPFQLNPTDIMKRRTAYFGMSRSGKSNGLKVVASSVYKLREGDPTQNRVGQLIFDISGEYAQDNQQDGKALHRIHEVLGLDRGPEVATYGLIEVDWDKPRKIMKLNFLGERFPQQWSTQAVEGALGQLLAGRQIIQSILADQSSLYIRSFRDADISVPTGLTGDDGGQVRYRLSILAYQTALVAAGLTPPVWSPSIAGLFGDKTIIKAMSVAMNPLTEKKDDYHQASIILKNAKKNRTISWAQLATVFTALDTFVTDPKSNYNNFEQEYITSSSSESEWADPRLKAIISIFRYPNGPRTFQVAQEQHSPKTKVDFAEDVVNDLRQGKLVIIDQSGGEPEQNRAAAERVMWRIFRTQEDLFKQRFAINPGQTETTKDHIIVYVEEAHNLLPRANAADNLGTVWARSAKEGSKLNLGMVLATQAPSSIMPEILSETDNWIISYLNSENERRVVAGYMDFSDFLEQIGKVSEQGFVRIRTLSQAYTVPVQLEKFFIGELSTAPPATGGTPSDGNGYIEHLDGNVSDSILD